MERERVHKDRRDRRALLSSSRISVLPTVASTSCSRRRLCLETETANAAGVWVIEKVVVDGITNGADSGKRTRKKRIDCGCMLVYNVLTC